MTARARREDGASLILALVFITTIGLVAAAIASLGFTSQRAAVIYTDQGRVANELDSAIQAGIERVRVREPFGCDGFPLPVPDPHARGRDLSVACDELAPGGAPASDTRLHFTASFTAPCPAPRLASAEATVVFSTIGGAVDGARVARTTSWKVVPSTATCPRPQ